jgi:hypothetical protein
MADEDQDFHIESADAGASDVIPCEAGAIKKGGYVMPIQTKALSNGLKSANTFFL